MVEADGIEPNVGEGRQLKGFVGSGPLLPALQQEGIGGGGRDRTDDLMLAKHALSQLSYAPPTPKASGGRPPLAESFGGLAPSGPARQSRDGGLPPGAPQARRVVGQGRLELPTSRLSSARSNQLSYWPD